MAGGNNKQHADYKTIRAQLVGTGTYYSDPEFPRDSWSLYFSGRIPSDIGQVVWKRAKDLHRNPEFIVRGARSHDLDQGALGDCWFIAAAVSLATGHAKLLEKVVPPDQGFGEDYAGVFHFYFWWYGEWKEVVVDDYLPTNGYQLIYCRNNERPNEFWPALLEKAYVKLHGGVYEGLKGGQLQNAMVDLTGGISEVIDLKDRNNLPPNLYDLLMKSFRMKSMQGCCIYNQNRNSPSVVKLANGLYTGHAYSITKFQQLKTDRGVIQLLRIRNPWGRGEWNGAWSDYSREMESLPANIKEDMRFQKSDEGEFWMSYEDFLRNFQQVQLCHLQVNTMLEEIEDNDGKQKWNVTVYHDEWIRGVTAGGCGNPPNERLFWKNPQFHVDLKKPDTINSQGGDCTMIVSLMKKEITNNSIPIGFRIYKLKNTDYRPLNEIRAPENALVLAERTAVFLDYRECTKRFQMPPGEYVIIPSTFNPQVEMKFMLRIFTEKFAQTRVMEEDDRTPPVPSPKDFVSDIFLKRCGTDNRLDAGELQNFLVDVSSEDIQSRMNFNIEQCRMLLPLKDGDRSGRLEFQEAKKLWKEIKAYIAVFLQFDSDRSGFVDTFELSTMFSKLGLPVSRPVLTSIVRRYGDRQNRISLEDFIVIIMRLIQLYNVFIRQEKRGADQEWLSFPGMRLSQGCQLLQEYLHPIPVGIHRNTISSWCLSRLGVFYTRCGFARDSYTNNWGILHWRHQFLENTMYL